MTMDGLVVATAAMVAVVLLMLSASIGAGNSSARFEELAGALAPDPDPPTEPVKLVFIHHSPGGNWLADPNEDQPYSGLGRACLLSRAG